MMGPAASTREPLIATPAGMTRDFTDSPDSSLSAPPTDSAEYGTRGSHDPTLLSFAFRKPFAWHFGASAPGVLVFLIIQLLTGYGLRSGLSPAPRVQGP